MNWLIYLVAWLIFAVSPNSQVLDSNYTMLLSEHLYRTGNVVLDDLFRDQLPVVTYPGASPDGLPYHVHVVDGHRYYFFPPGSAILSVPFVAIMNALGMSAIAPDGRYVFEGERGIQDRLAAVLMAILAVIVYRLARTGLPVRWSLVTVVVTCLGSQVWSTASRAMWSHTWGILLLATALLLVVGAEARGRPLPTVAVGSLLAWMYIVRPTFSISVVGILVYVLLHHRARAAAVIATAGVWLAGFVGYSLWYFRDVLPPYYRAARLAMGGGTHLLALAGNLVSPARGLFVFVPAVLVVAYLLLRYRRWLSNPALVAVGVACVSVHWVTVSAFPHWWAGHSFGPRLMTDVVPWLALLGIFGLEARQAAMDRAPAVRPRWTARVAWAASAMACALGIVINGAGAVSPESMRWNATPANIDHRPDRVWDWTDPQALAFLRGRLTGVRSG